LKEAYDSACGVVLYNIPLDFGIPMNLVRLIKMRMNKTYNRSLVGKQLSDTFPTKNSWKRRNELQPLLFNFALECAIKRVQVNEDGLKLNGTHRLVICADDVIILGESERTAEKKAKILIVANKEIDI
jgi:hypothetical protein